jgi:hypothetical protein
VLEVAKSKKKQQARPSPECPNRRQPLRWSVGHDAFPAAASWQVPALAIGGSGRLERYAVAIWWRGFSETLAAAIPSPQGALINLTARSSHSRAYSLEDQRSWERQNIQPMNYPIADARAHFACSKRIRTLAKIILGH